MGRTHVRIKGENLNFYLETQSTTHNIYYFKRIRILSRNLVHYTDVWMTLYTFLGSCPNHVSFLTVINELNYSILFARSELINLLLLLTLRYNFHACAYQSRVLLKQKTQENSGVIPKRCFNNFCSVQP